MADPRCTVCGEKLADFLAALGHTTHLKRDGVPMCSPEFDTVEDDVRLGREISDEVANVIRDYARNLPRTLQKRLGPSEIGHPCDRQIAYKLLDWPAVNTDQDPWPSLVGTAVHAMLAEAFGAHPDKYATELHVETGVGVDGTTDAYFLIRRLANDWKIVGTTTMREVKRGGPTLTYRTQIHVYAFALARMGIPVERVAITFLPRGGMLSGRHVWTERYRPDIAEAAFARLDLIEQLVDALTPAVDPTKFEAFAATPEHCEWCPFWLPNSTDLGRGCPGDGVQKARSADLSELIA